MPAFPELRLRFFFCFYKHRIIILPYQIAAFELKNSENSMNGFF